MSERVHNFQMKAFPGRSDFRFVTLSVSPSDQ
jgi:hypothetical protein